MIPHSQSDPTTNYPAIYSSSQTKSYPKPSYYAEPYQLPSSMAHNNSIDHLYSSNFSHRSQYDSQPTKSPLLMNSNSAQRYSNPFSDHSGFPNKISGPTDLPPEPSIAYSVNFQDDKRSLQVQKSHSSQSSKNYIPRAPSIPEEKQAQKSSDTFFTFKKDSIPHISSFPEVSSSQNITANNDDIPKRYVPEKAESELEDTKENAVDNTLNFGCSEVIGSKYNTPVKQEDDGVVRSENFFNSLEEGQVLSTPVKNDQEAQSNWYSKGHDYIESPELLRQHSRERLLKGVTSETSKANNIQKVQESNMFGFDSVGHESENKSISKHNMTGNPSFYTQQSPQINKAYHSSKYDGPEGLETNVQLANYKSECSDRERKNLGHNYYSYLSSIILPEDGDIKKQKCSTTYVRSSSQPSLRHQNFSQEYLSKPTMITNNPENMYSHKEDVEQSKKGNEEDKEDKEVPQDVSANSSIVHKTKDPGTLNILKNILKPNAWVSKNNYIENNKKSNAFQAQEPNKQAESILQQHAQESLDKLSFDFGKSQQNEHGYRNKSMDYGAREPKPWEKYIENLIKKNSKEQRSNSLNKDLTESKNNESVEEWLMSAHQRASQILKRINHNPILNTQGIQKVIPSETTVLHEEKKTERDADMSSSNMEDFIRREKQRIKSSLDKYNVVLEPQEMPLPHSLASTEEARELVETYRKHSEEKALCNDLKNTEGANVRDENVQNKEASAILNKNYSSTNGQASLGENQAVSKQNAQANKAINTSNYENIQLINYGSNTSVVQYSDSQTMSNNLVCIGSRIPTTISKEGETIQITEEVLAPLGRLEMRLMFSDQKKTQDTKKDQSFEIKTTLLRNDDQCINIGKTLQEKKFVPPSSEEAANVADLEDLQNKIMNKIEGIHTDIIQKITQLSNKIDSEESLPRPSSRNDATSHHNIYGSQESQVPSLQTLSNKYQHKQYNSVGGASEASVRHGEIDSAFPEEYEYDSQSRTFSTRPPLPVQAKQGNGARLSGANSLTSIENSGYWKSNNNTYRLHERKLSNFSNATTSHNASVYFDHPSALDSYEKSHNLSVQEDAYQRSLRSNENGEIENSSHKTRPQRGNWKIKNISCTSTYDLPKPLSCQSQNKLSEFHSQAPPLPERRLSGSRNTTSFVTLNLVNKSISEKKESLESELNEDWGTNLRFSARRYSMLSKNGSSIPMQNDSQSKQTKPSESSHSSTKTYPLAKAIEEKLGKKAIDYRQTTIYLETGTDISHKESLPSHAGLDTSQVHSVNHELERLERKLEKYMGVNNSGSKKAFSQLESIQEIPSTEAYYSVGNLGKSSGNKNDNKLTVQKNKNGAVPLGKVINRPDTREIERKLSKVSSAVNVSLSYRKATITPSKEKSEIREVSPFGQYGLRKDKHQVSGPINNKSLNKKIEMKNTQDASSKMNKRKSFCC